MNIINIDYIVLFHRGGIGDSVHDLGIIDALIRNGAKKIVYISLEKNKWILTNFNIDIIFIEAKTASLIINFLTLIRIFLSRHILICSAGTNIHKIKKWVDFIGYKNLYGITESKGLISNSNNYFLSVSHAHRIEANSQLLSLIGLIDFNSTPIINLDRIRSKIDTKKLSFFNGNNYFVLHNGSDINSNAKKINSDNFINIALFLTQNLKIKVLVLGGKNEINLNQKISYSSNPNIINLIGKTNILETIYLVSNSSCVIGPDSMLGHIAAACSVPTVSFFGPTDPRIVRPLSNAAEVISKNLHCSPCYSTPRFNACPHDNICMNNFNLDELSMVINKIQNQEL